MTERLAEFDALVGAPGFWDDNDNAQGTLRERGDVEKKIKTIDGLAEMVDDAATLIELGQEEGEEMVADDLNAELAKLDKGLEALEFERMLSGEHDRLAAIVAINPGAGGTESQDWAEMLLRMYLRYCERQGWKTELLECQAGQEAGIQRRDAAGHRRVRVRLPQGGVGRAPPRADLALRRERAAADLLRLRARRPRARRLDPD